MGRGVGRLVPVLLAVGLAVAGCGGDDGGGGGQQQPAEELVIGISLPLTGEFSQPGTAAQRGYEIWRDMVNQRGGILGRQVRLVIRDDASNQDTVVADYNRLITQDRVDLLLGTFSSLLNIPASAVAERNKMVYLCPACGSPNMFNRGFRYIFFAQPATAPHQADLFAEWVRGLPADQRPRTAAYPSQDDPFAAPVIEGVREKLEAAGVRTVYNQLYPADTTNFDPIASAVKNSGAELVAHGAVFEDGVGLVRSMIKAGYNPKALFQTSAPSNGAQYANGVGQANTAGIFYAVSWSPEADYPLNQEFVAAYKAKFNGEVPPEDAANAFDTAQALQAGVQGAGEVNQDKIRDWLHANTVQTIVGPLSWDDTGAPEQSFLLAQWQGGQSQIVLPQQVATSQQIIHPKPAWQG